MLSPDLKPALLLLILASVVSQSCAADIFVTSSSIGVLHIEIPGVIPGDNATAFHGDAVQLHVFVTGRREANFTYLKGYFFAEATAKYILTPWGQCSQPSSIKDWRFPVKFKPHLSTECTDANVSPDLWQRMHVEDPLAFPVPFTAKLPGNVTCMEVIVKDWLHTAEVCLRHDRTVLDEVVQRHQPHNDWSVWSVLTPFRRSDQVPAFVSTLVHYIIYHTQVGFSGSLLYANPYLLSELLKDTDVLKLVEEGRLVLLLWDRFNRYQEVDSNKTYYDVPDQILVLNHALLAFSQQPRVSLFMGDIDEFFVPLAPLKSVQDLLRTPSCLAKLQARKKKQKPRPWGAINLLRMNYQSSVTLKSKNATHDATLWEVAPRSMECSPLHTYSMSMTKRPLGSKALLRASGGVHSWHVHLGLLEKNYDDYGAYECAFVLHVVNLWSGRIKHESFNRRRGLWRQAVLPGEYTTKEYVAKCLQGNNATLS